MAKTARQVADKASIIQPPVEVPVVVVEAVQALTKRDLPPPVPGMDAETEDDLLRAEAARELEKIKASRVEAPRPVKKSDDMVGFVKNGNTHEIIQLNDGTTFCFGKKSLHVTDDKKLIKNLRAVAHNYGILEQ